MYPQPDLPTRITIPNNSKTMGPKLAALRESTMRDHLQLINSQSQKMRQANEKINNILAQIRNNKVQCQQTINNLNLEIHDLDTKVASYSQQTGFVSMQEQFKSNIKNLNQSYINTCKERVRLANEIDLKALRKVDIEDKTSPANDLFKWILASIYNEPGNKFFWPNFKEEALVNDQGKDFIERLGKVSALNVTEEQKLQTEKFLQKYNEIAAAPQLKKNQDNANRIKQIAQHYKKGYQISSSIKENQTSITKARDSTMEKDEQFVRWKARSEALKDRVKTNQDYLQMLNNIGTRLEPKSQAYSSKLQNSQALLNDFQSLDKWNPTINLGTEPKGNCQCNECSLF